MGESNSPGGACEIPLSPANLTLKSVSHRICAGQMAASERTRGRDSPPNRPSVFLPGTEEWELQASQVSETARSLRCGPASTTRELPIDKGQHGPDVTS